MSDSQSIIDTIQFGTVEELESLFLYRNFSADMDLGAEWDHDTPIHVAAYYKQLPHLKFLVHSLSVEKRKKALNALNADKSTPLHEACYTCLSGSLFQEENPKASPAVIAKNQREYERQCLMMPFVVSFLMEQGADSFRKKTIIDGKKYSVLKLISFLQTLEEIDSPAYDALSQTREKVKQYLTRNSFLQKVIRKWKK